MRGGGHWCTIVPILFDPTLRFINELTHNNGYLLLSSFLLINLSLKRKKLCLAILPETSTAAMDIVHVVLPTIWVGLHDMLCVYMNKRKYGTRCRATSKNQTH